MSEQDEGFFDNLGDMVDEGMDAAGNLAGAAVDFGAGVIDLAQAGAQAVSGGWDVILGNEAGYEEHSAAYDQNVDEAYENFDQAYDQIF